MSCFLTLLLNKINIKNTKDKTRNSTLNSKKVVSFKKEKTTNIKIVVIKPKAKTYPYFKNMIHGIKKIAKTYKAIRIGSLNNMIIFLIYQIFKYVNQFFSLYLQFLFYK